MTNFKCINELCNCDDEDNEELLMRHGADDAIMI